MRVARMMIRLVAATATAINYYFLLDRILFANGPDVH